MTKSTKIMLSVIGAVMSACIIVTAGVSVSKRGETPDKATTISDSVNTYKSTDNYIVTETTSPAEIPGSELIGEWTDGANLSGYKFYSDGRVDLTFVNFTVPVINMPINGTFKGTYTVSGDTVVISHTIGKNTKVNTYTYSVENNTLKLYNVREGETVTYTSVIASESDTTFITEASSENGNEIKHTGITGNWINGSGDVKYSLNENSTLSVTFTNAKIPAISKNGINGTYSGVYMTDEADMSIIMQYTVGDVKITESYNYKLTENALSLTDKKGDTSIFVRQSSNSLSSDASSLIGQWTDSADLTGYNFKEGGMVDVTLVNFIVPVINMPINGTFNGTYTINGDEITISWTVGDNTNFNSYTYSVDNNILSLTNINNGEILTYRRK